MDWMRDPDEGAKMRDNETRQLSKILAHGEFEINN
jgi:hypothetical protein